MTTTRRSVSVVMEPGIGTYYSRANGSLPPLPSGARSSKGTAWNCVGRPAPGIILGLFVTGAEDDLSRRSLLLVLRSLHERTVCTKDI